MRITKTILWVLTILLMVLIGVFWNDFTAMLRGERGLLPLIREKLR